MTGAELSIADRERRVLAVVRAARRLADPQDPLAIEARRALPAATGLSEASVALSLSRHLETSVTPNDLAKLVARAGTAPRVHVVLSANVFTGVVRAVALAVAAAPSVIVRPSTREAVLAPLLQRALLEQGEDARFDLSSALEPTPGDHVHVYGRHDTIAAIAAISPPGVIVRGHGPGFGVAIVRVSGDSDRCTAESGEDALSLPAACERLSWDIVAFDQRGCLSPRVAFVEGSLGDAEHFASSLALQLDRREKEVPRGALSEEERRDRALYRQSLQAVGQCHDGVTSVVGLDLEPRSLFLPPPGRHIHLARVDDGAALERLLAPYGRAVTCFGVTERSPHAARLAALSPGARLLPLGNMQRPPLDGPVDLREMV